MKRKLPSIDIAQSVMQRIERDGIRMRSKRSIRIKRYLRNLIALIFALASGLGVLSLAYVIRNDIFTGYSTLLSESEFLSSLPWQGVVTTIISSAAFFVLVRKLRDQKSSLRLSYVVAAWVLVAGALVGIAGQLPSENTPSVLAKAAFWADKDPTKFEGEIVEIIDKNTAKVKVGDKIITIYTDTTGLKVGDKILVIGDKKTQNFYVKGIKVLESAPEKKTVQEEEDEQVKTVEPPKPIEPKSETEAPAPKPTSSPEPTPEPDPAPGIYVTSKDQDATNVTITYAVYPKMAGKCKTTLKNDPLIAYSDYDWHPSPTNVCTNTIPKASLNNGAWTGIVYWKFPYDVWSDYYTTTFTINVTIP